MTAALEDGEWSAARPGRTLPPGKTRYPSYRRLFGPRGWSGRRKISSPTWIRSRTVCIYVLLTVHPDTITSLFLYQIYAQIIYFNTFTIFLYRVGRGIAVLFHDCGTRRWVSGQQHAPAALYPPGERPGTHCTGGWVGPRAGLDGGKSRLQRDSIPDRMYLCFVDRAS